MEARRGRRVELAQQQLVADLQRALHISLGWSDEYQHRFCNPHHYLTRRDETGLSPRFVVVSTW